MKKLLKLEKSIAGKKTPSALGGYAKMLNYGVSGAAWLTSRVQVFGMEFDAKIPAPVSVKEQYEIAFRNSLIDAQENIDKLQSRIVKLEAKLERENIKPKRLAELEDELMACVDEVDRYLALVGQLRKKLNYK